MLPVLRKRRSQEKEERETEKTWSQENKKEKETYHQPSLAIDMTDKGLGRDWKVSILLFSCVEGRGKAAAKNLLTHPLCWNGDVRWYGQLIWVCWSFLIAAFRWYRQRNAMGWVDGEQRQVLLTEVLDIVYSLTVGWREHCASLYRFSVRPNL